MSLGLVFPEPSPSSEDLPRKWKIEGIKYIAQKENYCGPAALTMILEYYGHRVSQRSLGDIWVRSRGVSFQDIVELAYERGFKAEYLKGDFEELKKQLAQNHPIYVSIRIKERHRFNHAIVVSGYNDITKVIYGPGRSETDYKDFLEYWQNAGNRALLITPRSEADIQAAKTAKPRARSAYKWLMENKPSWWNSVRIYIPREESAKGQYYKVGELFDENKKLIKAYAEMIRLHPEDPYYCAKALVYIGNNYFLMRDYEMQSAIVEKLIEIYPEQEEACSQALYNKGNFYSKNCQHKIAEETFHRIVEDYPDQLEYCGRALRSIARIVAGRGDYDLAENYYQRSLEAYPKSHRTHAFFGDLKYLRGDLQGAIISYQNALEHNKDYSYAMRRLGKVYAAAGNKVQAEKMYRRFVIDKEERIKKEPDEHDAYYSLGKYYVEVIVDPPKALEYMKKALDRCDLESDWWVPSNLGFIYMKNGDPERGLHLINQVLEKNPKDEYSHYRKALVLEKLGRIPEAITELEDALSLSKCFEYYNETKELLAKLKSRQEGARRSD